MATYITIETDKRIAYQIDGGEKNVMFANIEDGEITPDPKTSVLLSTVEFDHSNEMVEIAADETWDDFNILLFIPDIEVTAAEGQTGGNWLNFKITGDKGNSENYEGTNSVGKRDITNMVILTKGWYSDRYYWRWIFLLGRGGSLQLKTPQDLDSEAFSDLKYYYGGYSHSETAGILTGTVKVYGVKIE